LATNIGDENVREMAFIHFALVALICAEMTSCLTEEDAADLMLFAEAGKKLWKYDRVIVFRNVYDINRHEIFLFIHDKFYYGYPHLLRNPTSNLAPHLLSTPIFN
jgi:hypothetical protein